MSVAIDEPPPFRPVHFAERRCSVDRREDGTIYLASGHDLDPYPANVMGFLEEAVEKHPDRTLLAERTSDGEGWTRLTYEEVWQRLRAIGQALLNRGLDQRGPVMILSGNSIEHCLLSHAAQLVGVPVAPISPSYALLSEDCAKVKYCFDLVEPRLVFVQDASRFNKALEVLDLRSRNDVELVVAGAHPEHHPATDFQTLLDTDPTHAVDDAYRAVSERDIAKFLFTSGSTGMPKCVINTAGMIASNHRMYLQVQPPVDEKSPVFLEWLPWNHTMGGNIAFPRAFSRGGTFYLDDGRPVPGQFDKTLRNLREISPTYFSNVPIGYSWLAQALENDPALARTFFKDLEILAYGGASLPRDLYDRMEALAVRYTGKRIPFVTGWGCTETAPVATSLYWPIDGVGVIGLPLPGVTIKMVPNAGKHELRIKGPNVFPGYHKRPDLSEEAFDEEGFFKIGDAGRFVDPEDPLAGLAYDGRVTEDFKLETGTWVHVGTLRIGALAACTPVLQDAVICGHDRDFVGMLAWPNIEACREVCTDHDLKDTPEHLVRSPEIVAHVRNALTRWNQEHRGSSTQVHRVLIMTEPPQPDANEITDKGYINQRATRERRAGLIQHLYADPPAEDVIVIP